MSDVRDSSPPGQDTRRSSPDVVNDPSASQVEQDLGFFVAEGGRSPSAAIPINPMANRFFSRQRRHSGESTNSDAAFIDHRNQQHSLSTSAQRRPTVTSRATPGRMQQSGRQHSNNDQDSSAMQQLRGLQISPPATPRLQPAGEEAMDDDAVIDHRPPSVRSVGSRGSRDRERRGSEPREPPPVFTPSLSRRPSDAERALDDVCFPHSHLDMHDGGVDGAARTAGPPLTHGMHGMRGGLPGLLPNFPYPFDFAALEELASAERELTSPAMRPSDPLISFSPPRMTDKSPRMHSDMDGKPRNRMRKLSESAGTGRNRYQRKLALFEGFGSPAAMASATAETQRRADQKTPLLGRTRSGRAVHADFGTGTGRPSVRRANSTTGAGAAESEKERPYRFSFYSNGLPSTIHARSLGEIPAEGQSFEELFSGKKKDAEQYSESGYTDGPDSSTPGGQNGYAQPPKSGNGFSRVPTMVRSDGDAEDNTWWLDVLCPTDSEMKAFSKCFGIHPLTTEDIQMEETREKIELFRNYYLVCFRSFDQDPYSPTYLEPLNMYVIVFREGTLSFHYRATPHPQNVRRRIKQLKDYISVSSDWISYALIDDITDAFGPLIQNIEYEVDSIDELVLILKETEQSDMLRRIGTCRKKVMGLLRLMGNKADVVKGLAKRCNENWSVAPKSDIGLYLSDIQDHLLTMTANLNHYEKILSRSHSNYLAQISIEMTEANNQINDVLSRLTALGTVLVPLNLVTGLWGMNVNVPGQTNDDNMGNLDWFFSIVAVLITFAVVGDESFLLHLPTTS